METQPTQAKKNCGISRRRFLVYGSTALASTTILLKIPGMAKAQEAQVLTYPKKWLAKLNSLKDDVPVFIQYPDDQSFSTLVKLGIPAGGGVGRQKDIVAFSTICTHQGGPLMGTYKPEYKTLGACPYHLTTFDLRRYGIVVAGQAYQSLPQILLEIEGNDIYAVGVMGLIFGRNHNLMSA